MEFRDLQSYITSLDELDLNYLNKNNLEPDYEKLYKPLWRANRKTESYKVEIFSDYEVFTPKYKCHVCNLLVPVMFAEDHELSERHRICLDIMDIALERTRGHVKHKMDYSDISYKSHIYFCNVCTKAVSLEHSNKHISSKRHLYCQQQEQFLSKLLSTYSNEDIDFNDTEVRNADTDDSIIENAELIDEAPINLNCKDGANTDMKSKVRISIPDQRNINDDLLDRSPTTIQKCDKAIMVQLENVTKPTPLTDEMSLKIPGEVKALEPLCEIENLLVLVKTKDGCFIKVPFESYNGIVTKNNEKYCLFCSELVGDLKMHVSSRCHVRKVSMRAENVHCIREVNNFLSHCILCNELVVNTDSHTKTIEHFANINKLLKDLDEMFSDGESLETDEDHETDEHHETNEHNETNEHQDGIIDRRHLDTNYISADVDFISETNNDESNNKVIDVTDAKNVKVDVTSMAVNDNNIKPNEREEKEMNYQIMKNEIDELVCKVCNAVISNIEAHLTSANHAAKYLELLKVNKLEMLSSEQLECANCVCFVLKGFEMMHVQGKKHRTKLRKQLEASIRPPSMNIGSINDLKSTGSVKLIVTDTIGSNTTGNTSKSPNTDNERSVNAQSDTLICAPYFCDTCQVQVPNRTANIEEHNNGASHRKKMLLVEKTGAVEKKINKNFCRLCNVFVSSKIDMTAHINSESHGNLHDLVMKTNRIWKRIDNMYFCDYCKVEISPFNEMDHVNGAKHLKNRSDPTKLSLEVFAS